jgi:hypothetical protein
VELEREPLLASSSEKQRSFLGNGHETVNDTTSAVRQQILDNIRLLLANGSVNTFPWKWLAHENKPCCLRWPWQGVTRKAIWATKSVLLGSL